MSDRAATISVSAGTRETPYLDSVTWDMHGHRKKVLFFLERLQRYAGAQALRPRDIRVLELGCGNGWNVALPIAEQGFDVTGVDFHEPSIASARTYNRLPNTRFVCGDVMEFQRSESWDAAILSDVLEHMHDPGRFLKLAVSHLRPDGIVLISIPNGRGPYEIEQFLIRIGVLRPILAITRWTVELAVRLKRRLMHQPWPVAPDPALPAYNDESGHVQFFTPGRFRRLLAAAGLRIETRAQGCWFGGDLTYFLFYFLPALSQISLRIADALPPSLVSTWYFECRRVPMQGVPGRQKGQHADAPA